MLLELARPLSFLLSLLSLYPVLLSAFFVPGADWEERLQMALLRLCFSGCICLASGLIFARADAEPGQPLLSTLPVRVFLWALLGMAILFAVSWYLDTSYVPMARRDCCRL